MRKILLIALALLLPIHFASAQSATGFGYGPAINPFNAGSSGYFINSSPVLNSEGNTGFLTLGIGAGTAISVSSSEDTFLGNIAGQLVTTGIFNTAVGQHSMGYETTGSGNSCIGNDACRDSVGLGFGAAIGKSAFQAYFGQNSVAVGALAVYGNSQAIILSGTATNNDVITLTFASAAIIGSPISVSITVTTAETLPQMVAAIRTAIGANSALLAAEVRATIDANTAGLTNTVAIVYPGSTTAGVALTITSSVSGSATEIVTITQALSSMSDNIGIGNVALYGLQMTSAFSDIAIGTRSLASLTSGSSNIGIGTASGQQITTGVSDVALGVNSLTALTTGQGNVAAGVNSLASLTTSSNNVGVGLDAGRFVTAAGNSFVGGSAGRNLTSGVNNTAIGTNALLGAASSTASFNVALGTGTLQAVTGANQNVAIGHNAGAVLTSGTNNVLIGFNAASATLTTGTNNILICTGGSSCTTAASGTNDTFGVFGHSTSPFLSATVTSTPTSSILTVAGTLRVGAAPTITSGFSATPALTGGSPASFSIALLGGTPTASGVIAMPTAPNGWSCMFNDETTSSTAVFITKQTASTTTSVTVSNFTNLAVSGAWVAGDVIKAHCLAY